VDWEVPKPLQRRILGREEQNEHFLEVLLVLWITSETFVALFTEKKQMRNR
jgi:hypothetical protein